MTTPDELRRTLAQAGAFLKELRGNQSLPEPVRQEARRLLRHYPSLREIAHLAKITEVAWGGSPLGPEHDPDWLRGYEHGRIRMDSPGSSRSSQAIAPRVFEAIRQPGHVHLSPLRFRQFFNLGIGELERSLGAPFWLLRKEPDAPLVQLRLLAFLRVHSALIDLGKDPITAAFHLRHTAIPAFRHRTLFEVVRDGRVAEALDYLDSISSDFVG